MNIFKRKRRGPTGEQIIAKTYSARHRFPGEKKPRTIPLHVTRKDVAEKLARDWVAREERKLAGLIVDPVELETAEAPLGTLIEEFRVSLQARGLEADYVRKPVQRCRDLFKSLGWRRVADANPIDLRRHLEQSTWAPSTRQHYLVAAKQFYNWLLADGRIPRNPIADVRGFKVANTETFDRAAFTEEEVQLLVLPDTQDVRRLYRADVYALMIFSGLRWKEAGRLQVRDIRFDEEGYSITIPRGKDKSRRGDVIELPSQLDQVIKRFINNRKPSDRLLYGGVPARRTFQRDCERAGIERERSDGSRIVRYSSRDTYTSVLRTLARSTDQLRALTRHTTRGMEDRYTDRKTQGLRALVEKIPTLLPPSNEGSLARVHLSVHPPAHTAQGRNARGFDSPRLHCKDRTDQDGSPKTIEDLNRSTSEICDDSGKVHEGPPESSQDPQSPKPSVHMSVNRVSTEDAAWDTIVAAWPRLTPDECSRLAAFVRELVGEPSPTAGPTLGHEDPPTVRQNLTDGGSSIVTDTEPVEGSRRHEDAVPTGSAVGTRLPAVSDPGAGGDSTQTIRCGDARDADRARGEVRGPDAADSDAEGGAS